ncbi:MAG: bifunctional 3-deoxy-7-phosphoheptulonate synthase/chorismate mutase type II [Bacteroidota bacterium]
MNIIQMKDWGLNLPTEKPIVIAGPCSAENDRQVFESCLGAYKNGAHILRAGIWKPRTRPNSFEGVGAIGLTWLNRAKRVTGLPVCVEVANARHVYEAIKAQVDILWIGARTTVNPFAVQEIADALEGIDIPVMVKNPINPDLKLWMGAIERLHKAGIHKIAAIHRGFSAYKDNSPYRNRPEWEIPIELQRQIPNIEIICDPSHIAGARQWLQQISQKAMDLNFDGLMIETHCQPEHALSDAKQQVTPDGLGTILNSLVIRESNSVNQDYNRKLDDIRADIDILDYEIMNVLSKRMELVQEIGRYKKQHKITILQMARWEEILDKRLVLSRKKGLSDTFTRKLLENIHTESIRQQTAIMNGERPSIPGDKDLSTEGKAEEAKRVESK